MSKSQVFLISNSTFSLWSSLLAKKSTLIYVPKQWQNDISIYDIGPHSNHSVDYPDYAKKLSNRIKLKKSDVGILVCGSGTGMAISANKIRSIRAAVCYNLKSTRLSRQHNDANIITLGARLINKKLSLKLVEAFLMTKFEGGRHLKRIKKI